MSPNSDPHFHHFLCRSVCTALPKSCKVAGSPPPGRVDLGLSSGGGRTRVVYPRMLLCPLSSSTCPSTGLRLFRRSPSPCPDPATSASKRRPARKALRTTVTLTGLAAAATGVAVATGVVQSPGTRGEPRRLAVAGRLDRHLGHPDRRRAAPRRGRVPVRRPRRRLSRADRRDEPRPGQGGRARPHRRPRRRRPGEPRPPRTRRRSPRRCCRRSASTARRCPAWSRCGWARAAGA